MTETLRQLIALVDQEATEFETRKILDAAKTRGELKSIGGHVRRSAVRCGGSGSW